MKINIMKNKKGFTLIELLVVVLIIGILAGIALPQYQRAVTKSRVASILPIMRRWKDALMEYKLQHGDYSCEGNGCGLGLGATLGVNWPSDWKGGNGNSCGDRSECWNDYWYCFANEESNGYLFCSHDIDYVNDVYFSIDMFPADYEVEYLRDRITCTWEGGVEAEKVCKALGGHVLENNGNWGRYSLN